MINFDDESLLSAYLDGQLEPDEARRVELALAENARLSDQLRILAEVRDLVACLSRDTSVDVSDRVLARLASRPRGFKARAVAATTWARAHRPRGRAAALGGLAAAITLLVMVVPFATHRRGEPAPGGAPARIAVAGRQPARTQPGAAASSRASVPDSIASGGGSTDPGITPLTTPDSESPRVIAADDSRSRERSIELAHVRQFLDNPQLKRVFYVRDDNDNAAVQQVATMVEQTTRFGFYRITIAHGIVIDPRHPQEATVFALLVSPKELDNLKDRLTTAMNDRVEETAADPTVVTHLAGVEQVQACPAPPLVTIPRESIALRRQAPESHDDNVTETGASHARSRPGEGFPMPRDTRASDPGSGTTADAPAKSHPPARLSPRAPQARGRHNPGSQSALITKGDPSVPPTRDDLAVVLVWVMKPPPG